ncbi:Map microtubule affinity-regulating kinase, partial [Rhizophlyctis rosea]
MLARKKVLGDYQVGKTIGQGAFSKVKLGFHKETGQKVAIKIIDKKQVAAKAKKAKAAQEEREKRKRAQAAAAAAAAVATGAVDPHHQPQQSPHHQPSPSTSTSPTDSPSKRSSTIKQSDSSTPDRTASPAPDSERQRDGSERASVPERGSRSVTKDAREGLGGGTPPSAGGAPAPSFVSQLQLEVQLLMRLDHPNVIRLYQVMETEDECFVIMEYATGGELIEYIAARDHLTEKEARRFFRQIISAMDHCHLANVVHRDLKLENLLLNQERNILISDFGLGRTFQNDSEELMKTFCGTPNYAAVELISGIPYVGVKSDIWAMGVVLYVMMTGRPPFVGENINALYSKIKAVDYKVPDYFSKGLRNLLSKILVKDPKHRIDMDGLRTDPWINFEEPDKPLRIPPKLASSSSSSTSSNDPSQISQFISGITYDQTFVIYQFRKHTRDGSSVYNSAAAPVAISEQQKRDIKRRLSIQ